MRSETPSPRVQTLLTGSERRGANWCWRPRGTTTALLVFSRSGRATVRADGRDHAIAAGDTVVWLPGVSQEFGGSPDGDPWHIIWVHYRPREGWPDPVTWPAIGAGVARIVATSAGVRDRIEEGLLEADAYARSNVHRGKDLAFNALERSLLWLDTADPQAHPLDDRIQDAVMFIARHLDRVLTVGTIAEAVHLSPSRLAHLFTEQVGTSPVHFVELKRIQRAQQLLESTSLSIRAVAEAAGYKSQFHFATRFKAITGTPPSDWRRLSLPGES